MAEAYLLYGTFRAADAHTIYGRDSIHRAVRNFIENGGFNDTGALIELVSKNKRESAMRGGMANAKKWEEKKK